MDWSLTQSYDICSTIREDEPRCLYVWYRNIKISTNINSKRNWFQYCLHLNFKSIGKFQPVLIIIISIMIPFIIYYLLFKIIQNVNFHYCLKPHFSRAQDMLVNIIIIIILTLLLQLGLLLLLSVVESEMVAVLDISCPCKFDPISITFCLIVMSPFPFKLYSDFLANFVGILKKL